jgi:hypothetical protein
MTGHRSDLQRWDLRGPVRACQIRRTRNFVVDLEFREDGTLIRSNNRDPNGTAWSTVYEYDGNRLLSVRTENGGELSILRIHTYDATGRLARVLVRRSDGSDRLEESYEFDSDGRKNKTVYVDCAHQRSGVLRSWRVEGSDALYSVSGAARLTTVYNEREQPIRLHFYDDAGIVLSRVEFNYDADANLIEEAQMNSSELIPPEAFAQMNAAQIETVRAVLGASDGFVRRTHQYDANGRRVETRLQMGLLGAQVDTMAYNEYGDQIEGATEHQTREYGVDDNGILTDAPTEESMHRSEVRFRYDYDANRNWILKKTESRTAGQEEFTESGREQRTIEYFALPGAPAGR